MRIMGHFRTVLLGILFSTTCIFGVRMLEYKNALEEEETYTEVLQEYIESNQLPTPART